MHLQDHVACEVAPAKRLGQAHHRQFDQIRRRALDRGIDRHALAKLPHDRIGAVDLRDQPPAAQERLHVAVLPGSLDVLVQTRAHLRIAGEVGLDEGGSLLVRDPQFFGEAVGAHPIDDPEVDRFHRTAHLGRHVLLRHAVDERGGVAVDVAVVLEHVDQRRVMRQVRQNAQLNLGIIRRHQDPPRLSGDEGLANLPAQLGLHGDVLKIRLA